MTKQEREEQLAWTSGVATAMFQLVSSGAMDDPSAKEIADQFYGRSATKGEVAVVCDALRDVVDFASNAVDPDGNPVWGLERNMLTPVCDDYYNGVYIPYRCNNGRIRNRKIILRNIKDSDRAFLEASRADPDINFDTDYATLCVPVGGGKKYAGLYYSEDPLNDPIALRWLKHRAMCSEGGRIATQKTIRENGGSMELERIIFDEADATLRASGRPTLAPPLRQASLDEVQHVLTFDKPQ